jgi:hypothetical protein
LLIIENKIASPIRTHPRATEVGEAAKIIDDGVTSEQRGQELGDQLQTYGRWLAARQQHNWPGAICLLSHLSRPPEGYGKGDTERFGVPWQRSIRWHHIYNWLKRNTQESTTDWGMLALELVAFLEERQMSVETMSSYDIAAAEIFVGSADRIRATFKRVAELLEERLASVNCKQPSNYGAEYESQGSSIWDWAYLASPPAPRSDWFIGWGLRFPAKSQWWLDLDPPLPSLPHVFVSFGSDGKKEKPPIRALYDRLIPEGWVRDPNYDEMVSTKILSEFSNTSDQFSDALAEWIGNKIDDLKPILAKLLR